MIRAAVGYRLLLVALWFTGPAVALLRAEATSPGGLSGTRPNMVLVMTDDQGYGPIGRHGHPWIRTPHLDALYDRSARFTRFVVNPTCTPTRAALLTGRNPLKNGVTAQTGGARGRIAQESVLLPQVLQSAGYRTAIFGKWHVGDEEAYQPRQRGFDESFVFGGGWLGCSSDAPNTDYFDPVIRHNGQFVQTRGYCTNVFFAAALAWIEKQQANGDEPFFVYIATNAPHRPYRAPEHNVARFRSFGFLEGVSQGDAGYYGMVENLDDNIGLLLARLGEWQLLDNTVVILLSDNGTPGSAHGLGRPDKPLGHDASGQPMYLYNAGMKGFKGSLDEGGSRVPLFVRWDGRIQPGRDIDRLAAHIDLLPTLADLAGAPLPANQVEGRSLVPLLADAAAEWPDRYLFVHSGGWPDGADPDDHQWRRFAVCNQRFRLIDRALYDIKADPGQTTNVAGRHPEVVAAMRAAYDEFWRQARPLMVNEQAQMTTARSYRDHYQRQVQAGGIPEWNSPPWQLPGDPPR